MNPVSPSDQMVVVYDQFGATGRVFDTSYNELQAQHAFMRCLERYGQRANVRTKLAKKHYAEMLR